MNTKIILPAFLIVLVIAIAAYYLVFNSNKTKITTPTAETELELIDQNLQNAEKEDAEMGNLDNIEQDPSQTTEIDKDIADLDKELDKAVDDSLDDLNDL